MKKQITESLSDVLFRTILNYVIRKDVKKDPEFIEKIQRYRSELARISAEIDAHIKSIK